MASACTSRGEGMECPVSCPAAPVLCYRTPHVVAVLLCTSSEDNY